MFFFLIYPSDFVSWQLGKSRQGDVIAMLSHNSLELEVNSREWGHGRDTAATGAAEIFAAGSFVLCPHGLWIFVGKRQQG